MGKACESPCEIPLATTTTTTSPIETTTTPAKVISTSEYCCPEAKKCLEPSTKSCAENKTICDETSHPVCCPITQLCVKPGATCLPPPVCSASEYCCPDAKKCLTPSTVSCATNKTVCDGTSHPVCCPVTQLCVKPGNACDSPCLAPSTSFRSQMPVNIVF